MSNLPCPRLELRWSRTDDARYEWKCVYALVIPLSEYDIRAENEQSEYFVPINTTKASIGRGSPIYDGKVETPYRDGCHAKWDRAALGLPNLPIVAACGDVFTVIEE